MSMAAIGITAAVGAGLSMAKAVIQKKPFGSVLTDGLIGGAIGGATGGLTAGAGSLLSGLGGEATKAAASTAVQGATDAAAGAAVQGATQAAVPVVTDAATSAATQGVTGAATDAATTVVKESLPAMAATPNPNVLLADPSSSLSNTLGLGQVPQSVFPDSVSTNMDKFNVPSVSPEVNPVDMGKLGADIPTSGEGSLLSPEVNSSLKNLDSSKPWETKDYTQAINTGSQVLNTGMNLAAPGPQTASSYTQNAYAPQRASDDSLLNSLLNLSRS